MSAATATNGHRARTPRVVPTPASDLAQPPGSQLAAAVLRVQAAAPTLIRNASGQIQSRTYRYVTNDVVVDAVLPLMVEEQLLWRTFPTFTEDGSPALRYRMTHVPSGESDEDVMPLLGCIDSQTLGSAITYDRRYALVAYLNLTVDQDDDGAAASPPNGNQQVPAAAQASAAQAQAPAAGSQPSARPPRRTDRPATAKQKGLMSGRASEAGLTDGELANVMLVAAGEAPRVWQDPAAASRWGKRQLDRLPARLVDDVLRGIVDVAAGKAAEAARAKS